MLSLPNRRSQVGSAYFVLPCQYRLVVIGKPSAPLLLIRLDSKGYKLLVTLCPRLIPALRSMKKRKHLDENGECASDRLVRMVKCARKSICDRCMSVQMNGVRVCVCDPIMCVQRAITVYETCAW